MGKKRTIAVTPVGELILTKLKERGMTQAELATLSRIQPPTISDILAGRRPFNPAQIVAVALVLGLDAIELGRAKSDYEIMQVINPLLERNEEEKK